MDYCNCGDCVSDPALTCSITGTYVHVKDAYIANAYRGHLILVPGDAGGIIGGLLHQLDPAQHYSHMGIMVANHDLIRHSLAVPDRLTADEYLSGKILGVSVPAPIDGLNSEHVQHIWPGTVTQSVEQAYLASTYTDNASDPFLFPPGTGHEYVGATLLDLESPHAKGYNINALSFADVTDNGTTYPALVVQPCPELVTPDIAAALNRVADAAMQMYCHYRFYCYTDGRIGDNSAYSVNKRVPAAQPAWDPTTLKWSDFATFVNAPSGNRWTSKVTFLAKNTIPAVCSSFVWQAIQEANKRWPKIRLDWATARTGALGECGGQCIRTVPPDWRADTPAPNDGLYEYDEASRIIAAQWLHDSVAAAVYNKFVTQLAEQGGLPGTIAAALELIGQDAFIEAAELGTINVVALLATVVGPAVAATFGAIFVGELDQLLYDVPDDIANQICNAFASDNVTDVDSTKWQTSPGAGVAVSPDNIHMFWDAPGPTDHQSFVNGLYGWNWRVRLCVGVFNRPVCTLVRSTGFAVIAGRVFDDGVEVAGAYVEIGCQHVVSTVADRGAGYSLTVKSGGVYLVIARHQKTGHYGQRRIDATSPGTYSGTDIFLGPPPTFNRQVTIRGQLRVDDVRVTGKKHSTVPVNSVFYVQSAVPLWDDVNGRWGKDPNSGDAQRTQPGRAETQCGSSVGQLLMVVSANDDNSVDANLTGILQADDKNLQNGPTSYAVPAGATVMVPDFFLDTHGIEPQRAWFSSISIENTAAPAI